jgi:hypothetical protein
MKSVPFRRLLPLLLLVPFSTGPASSKSPQGWLSPLAADLGRTASFGEFRGDHLHAGVDFGTGGEVGLPVRAVADGRIVRMKVEWRGYGKALYIEHDGGLVSLYGHLDRFSEKLGLAQLVEAAKRRKGTRFPGEIVPERPIPVRAGEVVAWSGETGAGMPHLHFEIRRDGAAPVDPALLGIPLPADLTGAVPRLLRIVPARIESRVDGRPWSLDLPFVADGESFRTERSVRLTGPFRLAVEADDPTPPDHRTGLSGWNLLVDGRPFSSFRIETMTFRTYFLAAEIFDATRSSAEVGRYLQWLAPPPNGLFGPSSGSGLLQLAPGPHLVEIRLRDAAGRESSARVGVESIPATRGDPSRRSVVPAGLAAERFLDIEEREDGLVLRLDPAAPDELRLSANGKVRTLETISVGAERFLALPKESLGAGAHELASPGWGKVDFRIAPKQHSAPGASEEESPRFEILLPSGSPLFVHEVDPTRLLEEPLPVAAAARPGSFERRSPVLRVGPESAPEILGAKLRTGRADSRDFFYRWEGMERRWILAGDPSRSGGGMELRIRRAGCWAVFEDRRPPLLDRVRRFSDDRGSGLAVDAWDPESGIDREGVKMVLSSGESRIAELDPDRGVALFDAVPSTPFRLVAVDRAGNGSGREVGDLGAIPLLPRLPPGGTAWSEGSAPVPGRTARTP